MNIAALEAFAALVENRIPELAGRVCAGQAPSNELEGIPNLSIEPTQWMYVMDDAEIVETMPGNVVVYDVGVHQSSCVISIVASSTSQRAALEAKVLDLFLGAVDPIQGFRTPGTLMVKVTSQPEVGIWWVTFDLDSNQWNETLALDRRYESRVVVDAEIPALTIEAPVYPIQSLTLTTGAGGTPDAPVPPTDAVTINDDGSITIAV